MVMINDIIENVFVLVWWLDKLISIPLLGPFDTKCMLMCESIGWIGQSQTIQVNLNLKVYWITDNYTQPKSKFSAPMGSKSYCGCIWCNWGKALE